MLFSHICPFWPAPCIRKSLTIKVDSKAVIKHRPVVMNQMSKVALLRDVNVNVFYHSLTMV